MRVGLVFIIYFKKLLLRVYHGSPMEETKIIPEMDLKKRTRWAINQAIETNNLSNEKLSKLLGVNKNTINSYRTKKTPPTVAFIQGLSEHFGFNPAWLVTGEGPVYMEKGREERPMPAYKKAEETEPSRVESPKSTYGTIDFKISEMLYKATKVLESDTVYSIALASGILALYQAIEKEKKN